MSRSIYGSSHPLHTLVLEKIPATSPSTVQTAKRYHVLAVWTVRAIGGDALIVLPHDVFSYDMW